MKRILCIDGGGMKGYLAAAILAKLEAVSRQRCHTLFDLIYGTSIGGILAILLGCGMPAEEAIGFFTDDGPKIFRKRFGYYLGLFGPRYSGEVIEERLRERFKGLLPQTRIGVTAFDLLTQRPYFFRFRPEMEIVRGGAQGAVDGASTAAREARVLPDGVQLWQAARATSSAQIYFPAFRTFLFDGEHVFWDGGNVANNPAVCAYADMIKKAESGRTSAWQQRESENIWVLSVGCGCLRTANAAGQRVKAREMVSTSAWRNGVATVETLFNAGSEEVDYQMQQMLGSQYIRIQPTLYRSLAIDDASPAGLAALKEASAQAVREAVPSLQKFVREALAPWEKSLK